MVTVTRNTPILDRIDSEMKYLKRHGVKVGIFRENAKKIPKNMTKISKAKSMIKEKSHKVAPKKRGTRILEYALCLNFGTSKMEKKPFFFDSTQNRESISIIGNEQKRILMEVYRGDLTGQEALLQLGIFVQQRIKSKIMNNDYKNKPETIKYKKRNKENVLRNNDFLLNSISFEIVTL